MPATPGRHVESKEKDKMNQHKEYPQKVVEVKQDGLNVRLKSITPGLCTADCIAAHSQVWLEYFDNNGNRLLKVKYHMNADKTAAELIPVRSLKGQERHIDQLWGHNKLKEVVNTTDFQDMLTDLLQHQIATALASIGAGSTGGGGHNYTEFEDITI